MIVSSITSPAGIGQTTRPGADIAAQAEVVIPSRALVPLENPHRATERYSSRPSAPFVAHLITMAEQAPQTRPLRRETPAVAHDVYGRATAKGVPSFGKVVSQSV